MTTILQISDTHIIPKGSLVSNVLDTSASLKKLVIRINKIRPQIENIDCVLVSGEEIGRAIAPPPMIDKKKR